METFSVLLVICAAIPRSPVNFPHKGQWHRALVFSLICAWINGWANNREAGDLRRHRAHYDVAVMICDWYLEYSSEYYNGMNARGFRWLESILDQAMLETAGNMALPDKDLRCLMASLAHYMLNLAKITSPRFLYQLCTIMKFCAGSGLLPRSMPAVLNTSQCQGNCNRYLVDRWWHINIAMISIFQSTMSAMNVSESLTS